MWCRSCISKAFFFWANPIITTAYNRGKSEDGGLLESDLFDLPTGFTAEDVANESRELWTQQVRAAALRHCQSRYALSETTGAAARSSPSRRRRSRTR